MQPLWLKLTLHDGSLLRVNMNLMCNYEPHTDKSNAKVKCAVEDCSGAFHVQETAEQIDNAMTNPASALRLIKVW